MTFDPRTMGTPVYEALLELRKQHHDNERLTQQKGQAVELYTYLSTWGMMRLKAEEQVVKEGKKDIIEKYFACLEKISPQENLTNDLGLKTLKDMSIEEYLGLTGLGLALAQEFSFWATVVYHD